MTPYTFCQNMTSAGSGKRLRYLRSDPSLCFFCEVMTRLGSIHKVRIKFPTPFQQYLSVCIITRMTLGNRQWFWTHANAGWSGQAVHAVHQKWKQSLSPGADELLQQDRLGLTRSSRKGPSASGTPGCLWVSSTPRHQRSLHNVPGYMR